MLFTEELRCFQPSEGGVSHSPFPAAESPPSPSFGPVNPSPASCETVEMFKKTKIKTYLKWVETISCTQPGGALAAYRLSQVQFVQLQHCLKYSLSTVSRRWTDRRSLPLVTNQKVTFRMVATTSLSFSLHRSFWTQKLSCCSSCLSAGKRREERSLGSNRHSLYLPDGRLK